MNNTLLIKLINELPKTDINACKKWLQSPFHNKRKDVIVLFEYILGDSEKKNLDREVVFKSVYPKAAFSIQDLRTVMSRLLKLIEDFLVYRKFQDNKTQKSIWLTKVYKEKNLEKHFEKTYSTSIKQLEKQSFRNEDFHHNKFQLLLENYSFNSLHNRVDVASFQKLSKELLLYIIAKQLKYACMAMSIQNMTTVEFEAVFTNFLIDFLEKNSYQEIPAIGIYYHGYLLLKEENAFPHFEALKRIISVQAAYFPKEELYNIYILLINYCIKQSNKGKKEYVADVFQLYQQGIEQSILLENGFLSRFNYKNIVSIGIRLKKFDWVYTFMHKYKEKLDPKHSESTFHYNLAIYYYQKPDYEQAMQLLQRVDFDDLLYNLDARRMLLKIYYTLDEIDPLYALLDSFRLFIYRHQNKIGYHKSHYLNLIKFTKQLLKLDFYNKKAKEDLYKKITESPALIDKEWLLEQLRK